MTLLSSFAAFDVVLRIPQLWYTHYGATESGGGAEAVNRSAMGIHLLASRKNNTPALIHHSRNHFKQYYDVHLNGLRKI